MAVGCASRFAVLKLEDEELEKKPTPRLEQKPKDKGAAPKKKTKKNNTSAEETAKLKNLAFGPPTPRPKKQPGSQQSQVKKKSQKAHDEQWEEWKKKDREYITDSYKHDLEEAILLSRLEFEGRKDSLDGSAQNGDQHKKSKDGKQSKKDKVTMSLEEFSKYNGAGSDLPVKNKTEKVKNGPVSTKAAAASPPEENIFEKVAAETNDIIQKEKKKKTAKKKPQPPAPEGVRILQYQDDIDGRDKMIEEKNQEITKLKEELSAVKNRFKRLCSILAQAEVREKAQVLVQVEDLTKLKDELTQQVSELHAALEQERSKVHSLQSELKNLQGHKAA